MISGNCAGTFELAWIIEAIVLHLFVGCNIYGLQVRAMAITKLQWINAVRKRKEVYLNEIRSLAIRTQPYFKIVVQLRWKLFVFFFVNWFLSRFHLDHVSACALNDDCAYRTSPQQRKILTIRAQPVNCSFIDKKIIFSVDFTTPVVGCSCSCRRFLLFCAMPFVCVVFHYGRVPNRSVGCAYVNVRGKVRASREVLSGSAMFPGFPRRCSPCFNVRRHCQFR